MLYLIAKSNMERSVKGGQIRLIAAAPPATAVDVALAHRVRFLLHADLAPSWLRAKAPRWVAAPLLDGRGHSPKARWLFYHERYHALEAHRRSHPPPQHEYDVHWQGYCW